MIGKSVFLSLKKSASNAREKITKVLQTKIDSNIPKNYKPNKRAGTFDDRYIEYQSEGYEKLSIKQYLESHIYTI